MSLGNSSFMKDSSLLDQLIEEINFQRTKEMRQLMKDDSGFVVLQGTTYWTDLFVRHFLFQEDHSIDCDDLLFFVRKKHVKGSSRCLPKYETDVEVFRKDSKKLPIGDPDVDWEETVYLNLIIHQFEYTLTLAICTRTSPKELQVLKRHSQKVYASPSRRKMDTKGESEEMTYPHICFMVDNFDEVFSDIVARDGEMVCVELVAAGRGRGCNAQAVIFLGSIRYDALSRVYDSRQTSLSSKVAHRMSFGLWSSKTAARCEFVRMKGPHGKGYAEMAVTKAHGSGVETPSSEPGHCAIDNWDSDWDEDPDDFFNYRHQRRLSDPSANFNNFCRSAWKTRDPKDMSRSENEGLDAMTSGVAEVQAGDLKDASSCRCCARKQYNMCDVYTRSHSNETPACLHLVAQTCELAHEAISPHNSRESIDNVPGGRWVRGREEMPCRVREMRRATLPRVRESKRMMPPHRRTPDGTDIYYWCDLKKSELDDGAYNPLWTMRGFTQTFHLWKEGKRQQSAPLNAFLTYVTLPWWSIAKDILDHREEPILTF